MSHRLDFPRAGVARIGWLALPRVARDRDRRRRGRPSRDRGGRRRDPRRRRQRRRRGGRRGARVVRRRDGDDRAARRRARDLLRRGDGHGAQPRLLLRGARARRAVRTSRSSCTSRCRSARSSCTTRSGRRRARCRACPPGSARCGDAHGRLPWARLVEPALRLARDGVAMPPAHVACLAMLEPVMTMREGARIYAPGGTLLEPGERARSSPGSSPRSSRSRRKARRGAYTGTIGAALLALSRERGGLLTADDLAAYARARGASRSRRRGSAGASSRAAASPACPDARAAAALRGLSPAERVVALVDALDGGRAARRRTRRTSSRSTQTATRAC